MHTTEPSAKKSSWRDMPVELQLNTAGNGKVLVNGNDLSNMVYRVELDMTVDNVGLLVLHCYTNNIRIEGSMATLVPATEPIVEEADLPRCEVCGEPATSIVVDTLRNTAVGDDWQHDRPIFPPHYFCPQHHRAPVEYSLTPPRPPFTSSLPRRVKFKREPDATNPPGAPTPETK